MEDILIPMTLFDSIAAIVISLSYFKNRRIESTSLIAAGIDASTLKDERNP